MANSGALKSKKDSPINIAFKELSFVKNMIFWVDHVSSNKNLNNAIFVRPFNNYYAYPQQLTAKSFNVKSNFHGYGGKSYKCIEFKNKIYLIWIDQCSKSIWFQIFEPLEKIDIVKKKYLATVQEPRQIAQLKEGNFDSSFVVTEKNLLYGICEIKNIDYLFSLNLENSKQEIKLIKKFDNFAGDLSSNPSANILSWIEWGSPYMPWERNNLFFGEIDVDGDVKNIKQFSNKFNFN